MKFNFLLGMTFFCINSLSQSYLFSLESPTANQLAVPIQTSFNSQVGQDEFVYTLLYRLLNKQDRGFYLEIGAGEPIEINNTCFFEKNYAWKGISLDIDPLFENTWLLNRKNPLLIADAINTDYKAILESYPKVIDYLTLDVDAHYDTVLEKLPLDQYVFKIITIEHDCYRYGDIFKDREREILSSFGYHLLCGNVKNITVPFEDWWIHPSAFPSDVLSKLTSLDLDSKNYRAILDLIQAEINNL